MPSLSVIDLAMFMLETPERPFNIGPLAMLVPPAGFKGNFADKLTARMLKRPVGEPWNQRFVAPRLGVPRLDIDADADPAPQVHRLSLAAPGSHAALFETICKIHSTPLDRSRLLWELYVIDGVEGGRVALYGKVHHGIIDGRTFVRAISNWLSTSATDRSVRAMWEGGARPAHQSRARGSLARQFGQALRGTAGTVKTAAALYGMLGRQALTSLGLGAGLPLPGVKVPKAFAGRVSARRSFAYCKLPPPELKAFGKAHGATVNDVLLTTLDMAMLHYLDQHHEGPRSPLVVDMPVALTGASGGNQIAVMQFPLGAPGASPLERLADVCAETTKLKAVLARETTDTVMLYTALVHGLPVLVEKLGNKRTLNISNLMVSNPFGLPERRYLMGAEAELILPVSVVAAGQMLNVTAVTLGNSLQLGFLAIPGAVKSVGDLAACTAEAFDELLRAAAAAPARKAKARGTPEPAGAAKPVRGKLAPRRRAAAVRAT